MNYDDSENSTSRKQDIETLCENIVGVLNLLAKIKMIPEDSDIAVSMATEYVWKYGDVKEDPDGYVWIRSKNDTRRD